MENEKNKIHQKLLSYVCLQLQKQLKEKKGINLLVIEEEPQKFKDQCVNWSKKIVLRKISKSKMKSED